MTDSHGSQNGKDQAPEKRAINALQKQVDDLVSRVTKTESVLSCLGIYMREHVFDTGTQNESEMHLRQSLAWIQQELVDRINSAQGTGDADS